MSKRPATRRFSEAPYDVTLGIHEDALAALDDRACAVIVKLLARVAERAYRRGAQHGAHLAITRPECLPKNLHDWRYSRPLDVSPWLDCRVAKPATERLFMENPNLGWLGLWEADETGRWMP